MTEVLIVEDDKATRDVMAMYLCGEPGRKCTEAKTLDEAMELVKQKRYDFIFLDLLMQDVYATPLIDFARDLYKDNPPTIIVMSAVTGAHKLIEKYRVNKFVSKPFDLDIIDDILGYKKL